MDISGKWKGFFTQQLQTKGNTYSIKISFEMNLVDTEDGFKGSCMDFEIEIGNREKSDIEGFVQDGMISFIKHYENTVWHDEEKDELVLEKVPNHIDINYYGNWDNELNKFSGTWEIAMEEEKEGEDYIEKIEYGYWEMAKIS